MSERERERKALSFTVALIFLFSAAFKGYALLKKISALEKKDYVGKLDEDISQKLKVGSVEVQWKGHLEKVYYPIPKEGHVRNKIKEELKWGVDRKSKFDKQKDFLIWSQEVRFHKEFFGNIFIRNCFYKSPTEKQQCIFVLNYNYHLVIAYGWLLAVY